jgi:FtsP/CotA-like multicopper oxidase with cupredoxin domain
MTPSVVQAKQGDTVTLKIQAHEPGELHLHGYDIEKELVAGQVTEMQFTADATGRFKLTFHAHASGHQTPPGGAPEEEEKEVGFLEVLPR